MIDSPMTENDVDLSSANKGQKPIFRESDVAKPICIRDIAC
jgi:hypothetical protein